MNQAFRTTQRLVVSALLLSAVAMAQSGANRTDTTNSTEHHSKFSKVAFWRHHKDGNKNTNQDMGKPATSKQAQPRAAQVKPVAPKQSQASTTQAKTVSAKQPASKTGQRQSITKAASPLTKKTTAKAPSAQSKKLPQKSTTAQNSQEPRKDPLKY